MNKGTFYSSDDFSNLSKAITDKHSPIKEKKVTDINADKIFMTKYLKKVIMDRSRLQNKYLKYPS